MKTPLASKHRVLLQRHFLWQKDSGCRTERSRTGEDHGPAASM